MGPLLPLLVPEPDHDPPDASLIVDDSAFGRDDFEPLPDDPESAEHVEFFEEDPDDILTEEDGDTPAWDSLAMSLDDEAVEGRPSYAAVR